MRPVRGLYYIGERQTHLCGEWLFCLPTQLDPIVSTSSCYRIQHPKLDLDIFRLHHMVSLTACLDIRDKIPARAAILHGWGAISLRHGGDDVIQIRCHSHSGVVQCGGVCVGIAGGNGPLGPEWSCKDESVPEAAVPERTVFVDRRRRTGRAGERNVVVQVRQKSRRHVHLGRSVLCDMTAHTFTWGCCFATFKVTFCSGKIRKRNRHICFHVVQFVLTATRWRENDSDETTLAHCLHFTCGFNKNVIKSTTKRKTTILTYLILMSTLCTKRFLECVFVTNLQKGCLLCHQVAAQAMTGAVLMMTGTSWMECTATLLVTG